VPGPYSIPLAAIAGGADRFKVVVAVESAAVQRVHVVRGLGGGGAYVAGQAFVLAILVIGDAGDYRALYECAVLGCRGPALLRVLAGPLGVVGPFLLRVRCAVLGGVGLFLLGVLRVVLVGVGLDLVGVVASPLGCRALDPLRVLCAVLGMLGPIARAAERLRAVLACLVGGPYALCVARGAGT